MPSGAIFWECFTDPLTRGIFDTKDLCSKELLALCLSGDMRFSAEEERSFFEGVSFGENTFLGLYFSGESIFFC